MNARKVVHVLQYVENGVSCVDLVDAVSGECLAEGRGVNARGYVEEIARTAGWEIVLPPGDAKTGA